MDLNTITLTVDAGVAVVTLNRPPVNAQNIELREEITRVFDLLSDRDDVACIVLTGAGKAFSAGADIRERPNLAGVAGAYGAHNRRVRESYYAVVECSKPIIAAINGPALGAGFGLVMASDIWVASEDAYVSMPEINVGLAGGASMLRTLFGRSTARRMFFTGQRLTAAELLQRNVIEAVLTPEELLPVAMKLAHEIAAKAPLAVIYAKRAANMVDVMPQRDAYRFEQEFTMTLSRTEDAREARMAFLEKREPQFKGR